MAGWHPSRYNDLVPGWSWLDGFAATTDGRHVYTSARDDGIFVFERVANEVPDDHADSRDAATPIASLPWSGEGELDWVGDRDVFRIEVAGPGTLTVYTTGDTDTYGRLTDADGDVLAEDDDAGEAPNFEIKADMAAGTYYVEVSGADGGAAGPYYARCRVRGGGNQSSVRRRARHCHRGLQPVVRTRCRFRRRRRPGCACAGAMRPRCMVREPRQEEILGTACSRHR